MPEACCRLSLWGAAAAALLATAGSGLALAQQKVHITYHWHMEQPIYWPDRQVSGNDRYERAWESILRTDGGAAHPSNNLREIFSLPDRVAGYRFRMRDSINSIRWTNEGGAQISYSGGLIENIQSLAAANQLGYGSDWNSWLREARSWSTTGGAARPRADIVLFSHHHALLPLLEPSTVRKQIQLYKAAYSDAWMGGAGAGTAISSGFFPSEMAFSTRMIPALAAEGVAWSFVSAEKISRASTTFPVVLGSGGVNTDPPNRADQLNVHTDPYLRIQISRGCAPAEAYPFSLTPRRARYVDPDTGVATSLIVVPCSQSLGWQDGYSPMGLGDINTLQTRNDPNRPMLLVLAHDGDNAWGGGFSYYMEAVPNFASQAQNAGYSMSTVERYLADHPVPANDFVHVEDGAWVNADGDFGAPTFLNWNWPLLSASGQVDIDNGWHEDARNWAVITAAQNRMDTAEQIWRAQGGTFDIRKVLYPDATTNALERGWHYFGGALNSGYMYYGTAEDFEVKPSVACNEALRLVNPIIAGAPASGPTSDLTPPTIWVPQRFPWNPGTLNFGPQFGYRQVNNNGDFAVYTFASDASGIPDGAVVLKYRIDADGTNALSNFENETYAGGAGVGAWQSITMTRRAFPAGNVYNNPTINFFEMPTVIADQYTAWVRDIRSKLVDYYVEATDSRGNVKRSPIQHVWIGDGAGAGGGGSAVTLTPTPPTAGQSVTISYNPSGTPLAGSANGTGTVRLHCGFNGWQNIITPGPALTFDAQAQRWTVTISIPTTATTMEIAFNNGAGTWDNNSGADYRFTVQAAPPVSGACCVSGSCSVVLSTACTAAGSTFSAGAVCQPSPCPPPPPLQWAIDGNLDPQATLVGTNGTMFLRAGLSGDVLYIAAPNTANSNDHFIFLARPPTTPGVLRPAQWAKAGQVAQWEAFLAAESSNGFAGWFDQGVGVAAQQQRGAVFEGTINLRQEFGLGATAPLPETIALAFAAYNTPDAGVLRANLQVPASTNNDGNLDASEYVTVRLCEIRVGGPACCPVDFDGNGVRQPADIFAFLNAYFGDPPGNLRTDFNGDQQRTPSDIFAFLSAYFVGC
jgi:hypothetical protein